ncbi:MAG: glutathione S-transferase family protein [Pseudomonadota bacterium]
MILLYHAHQTRSMRTLWLLHELGAPFEVQRRAFDKSLRDADYLDKHPAGRVPALEIDGQTLFESGAITEYLCERHPEAGLGRLAGDPERADWLVWVHFAETVSQHAAALTQQHVVLYKDWMRSPTVMKIEARRLEKCFEAIEHRLDGAGYLLPSGFSAADISVGQAVYMARHFVHLDPFPTLTEWYGQISDRPAFRAALPGADDQLLYLREFYPAWEEQR